MHEAIAVVSLRSKLCVVWWLWWLLGSSKKLASLVISIPIAQKKPLRLWLQLRLRLSLTCHQIDNLQWAREQTGAAFNRRQLCV